MDTNRDVPGATWNAMMIDLSTYFQSGPGPVSVHPYDRGLAIWSLPEPAAPVEDPKASEPTLGG